MTGARLFAALVLVASPALATAALAQVQPDSAFVLISPPATDASFMDMAHLDRKDGLIVIHMADVHQQPISIIPEVVYSRVEANCAARTLRMVTTYAIDENGKGSLEPYDGDAPVPVTADYPTDVRLLAYACGEDRPAPGAKIFRDEAAMLAYVHGR